MKCVFTVFFILLFIFANIMKWSKGFSGSGYSDAMYFLHKYPRPELKKSRSTFHKLKPYSFKFATCPETHYL